MTNSIEDPLLVRTMRRRTDTVVEVRSQPRGGIIGTSARSFVAEYDEAIRQAREQAWDDGRQSLATDFLQPMNEHGMRASTENPYRKVVG